MEKLIPLTVCPKYCDANFYVDAENLEALLPEEERGYTNLSELEADAFGEPMDICLSLSAADLDG